MVHVLLSTEKSRLANPILPLLKTINFIIASQDIAVTVYFLIRRYHSILQ